MLVALILLPVAATGEELVTVAAASNFASAVDEIAGDFTSITGHPVRITKASTGKLYAQIVNGAPFDVLLAADSTRPERLQENSLGVSGTRFTYALGALVLWSRQLDDCPGALENPENIRIAIANPDTAPYGAAAKAFLQQSGRWQSVSPRLVIGENISQTLQYAASGAAGLGFIARAQLYAPSIPTAACSWSVPSTMHPPIRQQAILLQPGADNEAAQQFLQFLRSDAGRDVILRHGYRLPDVSD